MWTARSKRERQVAAADKVFHHMQCTQMALLCCSVRGETEHFMEGKTKLERFRRMATMQCIFPSCAFVCLRVYTR
jgi:hypothetical protein